MSYYDLTDNEKFKIMIRVYSDIFVSSDHFAKKIGVARATVFNWRKKEKANFNTRSKIKICQGFNLLDSVWCKDIGLEADFEESLPQYKKIAPKKTINEKAIVEGLKKEKEKCMKIKDLSKDESEELLKNRLEKESTSFMFSFAKHLKDNKQIAEALNVLEWIEERESTFKYTHETQIRHFRAILLSHDSIQNWDKAIHILRSLYHSRHYHLEEPEVLTLLASNYKRKALDTLDTNKIKLNFLTSALCLYQDAYNLKPDNNKYYDAINLAYLYNILDTIESDYAEEKKEIQVIYNELSRVWRIDFNSWWEVISDAEFLMLLGDVKMATIKVTNFLELHKVKPFEIDATFRQLELYINFTNDKNAIEFQNYLKECWENIK